MGEERIYILKLVIVWCVRKIFVPFNRLDHKLGVYMEVVKVAQDAKSRKSAHANAKRALMETYLKRRKERRWTIKENRRNAWKERRRKRQKIKGERYREKTKGDNNERLREKGEGRPSTDREGRWRQSKWEGMREGDDRNGYLFFSLVNEFFIIEQFFSHLIFSKISVIFYKLTFLIILWQY